jgi:uncharacterized protein (DUF1501 family)
MSVMKRREFLKRTLPLTAVPFSLNGFRAVAFGAQSVPPAAFQTGAALDRVLVWVQLNGGNDGINTVIPLDQYSTYTGLRPNIAIPADRVLPLGGAAGLHPAMTGMKSLYDEEKLCVVQGVSYPNPNFSHFRATEIWLTASNYDEYLDSGWLGRYLEDEFPGYPSGYPNEGMPDPPALQIGSSVSVGFQGPLQSTAITIQNPDTFYQLVSGSSSGGQDEVPPTAAGQELLFVRRVASQSMDFAGRVKAAADRAQNKSALYPAAGQNTLADQLKIVARLIAGGLMTRTYLVSLGGFDTHSNQVLTADPATGTHAILLGRLSEALRAFADDLEILGCDHRVVTMTFSEFGRRVASNASLGTDHGTTQPVFLVGSRVKGGMVGRAPSLTDLSGGNLKMQFDFRTVYAAILRQWFRVEEAEQTDVLLRGFQPLDLIHPTHLLPRRRPT